jgi:pseudouridine-5'-phosphate glycosidase
MKELSTYMDITEEIRDAVAEGRPVVALESTILSHGMPYPQNLGFAADVEKIIRAEGAVPATMAVIDGRLKAGLTPSELERMCEAKDVRKVSRRDLPIVVAEKLTGATTVATTMILAEKAGIRLFATGGIGGVHRGGEVTMDISADLEELARTNVTVICAGAKAILDLEKTLEVLETKGVPVLGYQTSELPAFYTRTSGLKVDYAIRDYEDGARIVRAKHEMGLSGGILITNPIPEKYSIPAEQINAVIEKAIAEMDERGIKGKECTPFLLAKIAEITGGESLASNIQLVYNNAAVGTEIAKAYCEL